MVASVSAAAARLCTDHVMLIIVDNAAAAIIILD